MSIQSKFSSVLGYCLRQPKLFRLYDLKPDARETSPFKLVFFSGSRGMDYLNASLLSIYFSWDHLPEVQIVTDGSPIAHLEKNIISWPKKLEFIDWTEAAAHFKQKGNNDLHDYATKHVFGKKLVGILYLAEKSPIFYSDTDVLWFNSPSHLSMDSAPFVKMGEDLSFCYSEPMMAHLHHADYRRLVPLNSGLILISGDFSSHPQWDQICRYIAQAPDHRTEQTTLALLSYHFTPNNYWTHDKFLIKIDDVYSYKYTPNKFPDIWARHYVDKKYISFWVDFTYFCLKNRPGSLRTSNNKYIARHESTTS